MLKNIFKLQAVIMLTILMSSGDADAYIDPGTTSAVFSSLAVVFAAIAAALGFLIWPFKKFYFYLKEKLSKNKE